MMKKNSVFGPCASALLLGSLSLAGCTSDGGSTGPDATITVVNNSDFVIDEIYLTDIGSSDWGPNLVHTEGLFPRERLVVGVDCDLYDALLVDEDGVECRLDSIDLCLNDATWYINNNTCVAFGAALKARQQAAEAAKTAPADAAQ
jgi:hypothetical protein